MKKTCKNCGVSTYSYKEPCSSCMTTKGYPTILSKWKPTSEGDNEFFEWKDEMETKFNKLSEKIIVIDTEIESLIVSLDVNREIVEGLDAVGVVLYKLYNKIKEIID